MSKLKLLSNQEIKAMDKLKASYGSAKKISADIKAKRQYSHRKGIALKKGYGQFLDDAENFAKRMLKLEDYKKKNGISINQKAVATLQVSAWQGVKPTHYCLNKVAETGNLFLPKEMISVVPLTEDYVYGGDLITTLAICENIMGARFCVATFVGTTLPAHRLERISQASGIRIDTIDAGNSLRSIQLNNQGTPFGNFCGIEVSNDNHLVYLDSIMRTSLETGATFFLNPSWSTIATGCYFFRDIPDISFKVSCFLGVQNLIQFRMLLEILKTYQRADGTSAVCEINLGNALNAEKFIQANKLLKDSKIKGVSLTAHILIPPDMGRSDFNWFDSTVKVLSAGSDITLKYESDGLCGQDDTIGSYFLPSAERDTRFETLGEILYRKVVACDNDGKKLLKMGYDIRLADVCR
ncbi:MAG: hypothetical protein QME51_02730 [Planctomycetota bacterium]|nr:hypothetical protein [Planctomycetota bacterium]MDI6787269.1 hypothetical protein [Planctomycetota bacterium]